MHTERPERVQLRSAGPVFHSDRGLAFPFGGIRSVATFLFRCPTTKLTVQGTSEDDVPDDDGERYVEQECLACRQLHLVNPKNGKVLGSGQ